MIPLRQLVNTDHVVQNWILSTCFVCQATTKINITLFFFMENVICFVLSHNLPKSESHSCIIVRR